MDNHALKRVPDPAPAPDTDAGGEVPGPLPSWLCEVEERLRKRPGFFESLTPEQRAFLDSYDGPEVLGPPPPPPMKRRPRRRGEP
jgi:hypothetical protein